MLVRPGGSRHHVLTTGEVLNVRDVHTDPRISAESRRRYTLRGYAPLRPQPTARTGGRAVSMPGLARPLMPRTHIVGAYGDMLLTHPATALTCPKPSTRLLDMLLTHHATNRPAHGAAERRARHATYGLANNGPGRGAEPAADDAARGVSRLLAVEHIAGHVRRLPGP